MSQKISIVIPAHNAENGIRQCLESIYLEQDMDYEVIVVDDCSTDNTLEMVRSFPCKVVTLSKHSGAAVARNEGTKHSTGEIILFLDSDVFLQKNALKYLRDSFEKHPEVDAIQAVYTKRPVIDNLPSLARNYYKYHKIERLSEGYIFGLNSYCFAIKKEIFQGIGGFSPEAEGTEDVELGYRLTKSGYKILLNKNIQVKHAKSYTFFSLLRSDYRKVLTKTKLLLKVRFEKKMDMKKNSGVTFSLNRTKDMLPEILSVFLSGLVLASFLCLLIFQKIFFFYLSSGLFAIFVLLNLNFLNLIKKDKGILTSLGCLSIYYFEMLVSQLAILKGVYEYFGKSSVG